MILNRLLFLTGFLSLLLMGCEYPIYMETKVHEDGTLDKTISIQEVDSGSVSRNIFGISSEKGWTVEATKGTEESKNKYKITFKKSFTSADSINAELNLNNDTLFQIESNFKKQFRWFYTYIRYSETFKPIDRFKKVKAEDFFTVEDKMFIDRLPGDGRAITKADSFYLEQLNEKIFNHYANWGLYLEQYEILQIVIEKNLGKQWLDTLAKHNDFIFQKIDDLKGDRDLAVKVADSLKFPLTIQARNDFILQSKDLNSRVDLMSFARNGKYTNVIEMPWTIVNANADSVAGNKVFWKPLPTRFALYPYEMFVESRKLNVWAVIVSVVIMGLAVMALFKKSALKN